MTLYGSDTAIKNRSHGLHFWPAETGLIVTEICKAAESWDDFSRDALVDEVLDFGDSREAHTNRPVSRAVVRVIIPTRWAGAQT